VRGPALTTALASLVLLAAPVSAEEIHAVLPAVAAVCIETREPIEVDGDLSDAAWGQAVAVSGFTISGTEELADNQTSMRLLRDGEALYVGVRCQERQMTSLKADARGPDARVWNDDCVEIFFDPEHTHEGFLQLAVNSIAAKYDGKVGIGTWEADWQAATSTDDDGWTVELRIPFASLGIEPPVEGTVWGFNLCRERLAGGSRELHNWANVQANFHRPWLFGHLYFAGQQFELTPEVAARLYAAVGFPTRLYVREGYALVTAQEVAQRRTYQELVAEALAGAAELSEMREELLRTYVRGADAPYAEEFKSLDRRYRPLRAAAASREPVAPLRWAEATVQLGRLTREMHDLTWKVKIALLLRDA